MTSRKVLPIEGASILPVVSFFAAILSDLFGLPFAAEAAIEIAVSVAVVDKRSKGMLPGADLELDLELGVGAGVELGVELEVELGVEPGVELGVEPGAEAAEVEQL